jgi:carbamate kinase
MKLPQELLAAIDKAFSNVQSMDDIYGAFKTLDGMVRKKYEEMMGNGNGPSTGMPQMPNMPPMASLMPKIVADMESFLR